ncbi:unnamed protein product [Prorocentrum cordatum]|uniref:Uncharacterized protein n=1 Tax=Prorocentrum cordatum TaxID=2364126 RepID=A0ABN9VMZ6_9DINO|nr:unnamed protein product [Polarella glacialis]
MADTYAYGLTHKNTFLDCESPWIDHVTVGRRAKSDPSSDRSSTSGLLNDSSREQLTALTGTLSRGHGGPECGPIVLQQQDEDEARPEPANLETAARTFRQEMEEDERFGKNDESKETAITRTQRRHLLRKHAKTSQRKEVHDVEAGSSKASTKISL